MALGLVRRVEVTMVGHGPAPYSHRNFVERLLLRWFCLQPAVFVCPDVSGCPQSTSVQASGNYTAQPIQRSAGPARAERSRGSFRDPPCDAARVRSLRTQEATMATKAIVGEKVGMTQVWDEDNRVVPVTVLRVTPCRVVQVKT